MYTKFYHGTTKKMMVAFATVFDNIRIDLEDGREIHVPLTYAQGSKFLQKIGRVDDMEATVKPMTMPCMGFEWISMNYDPERHLNSMVKMQDKRMAAQRKFVYNRSPYSWQFDLFIAVQRLSDGLKIMEQIVPFFTPHLNLRVRGLEELQEPDNVQLVLTSWSHDIDYQDSMDEPRNIVFQFSFTMKGYLYQDVKKVKSITEAIMNVEKLTDDDVEERFMRMIVQAHEDGTITEEIKEEN